MPTQSHTISSPLSVRLLDSKFVHRLRTRPFVRLVEHFAAVIINAGQDSGASELNLGIGGILAILFSPGAFISMMLFDKYSSFLRWLRHQPQFDPYAVSLPDKYFFIVFSMVVTGIVVVVKWDRILPGRQDHANLAALPLRARQIFFANFTAISLLATIFAVDVNAASVFLYPLVVVAGGGATDGYLSFVRAHAAVVLLASVFTFFACFAIIGVMMTLLPRRVFRKVSMFLRLAIVLALLTMLCTSFAVPPIARKLTWLPSVWYLGLYQWIQGKQEFAPLGIIALKATVTVIAAALLFAALSYRRYFMRIPESADALQSERRRGPAWISALFDRFLLKTPFQRACFHFSIRALFRSEIHCILFGGFAGLGLVLASQMALSARPVRVSIPGIPAADLLAIPLAVAFFMIIGLRFAFEMPAGLNANWLYQSILDQRKHEAPVLARKIILVFLVPCVILPSVAAYSWIWGAGAGFLHTIFVLTMSLLLMELMLLRFRKIPFTCTLPLLQNNAIMMIFIYFIGFWMFTAFAAAIEQTMFSRPGAIPVVALGLGLVWAVLRQIQNDTPEIDRELVYQQARPPAVQVLNILP